MLPRAVKIDDFENLPAPGPTVEEKVLGQIVCIEFLSLLSPIDKVIILMLMFDFSKTDVAAVLGMTDSAVYQRLYKIRRLAKVLWGNPL